MGVADRLCEQALMMVTLVGVAGALAQRLGAQPLPAWGLPAPMP